MLRALSGYKNWRTIDRKNTQKELISASAKAGLLKLSAVTLEQVRELGLEELDLKDLRDKEPAQR